MMTPRTQFQCFFLVLLSLATLLRRSSAFNSPVSLQEELGSSPTLSFLLQREEEVFFDPLGLATDDNFSRYREAELKHGRVAMLAVVGSLIPYSMQHFNKDHLVSDLQQGKVPSLYHLFHDYEWTISGVIRFVVLCGFLETLVLVQISPQDMPGDYGLGYWGVRDKGKHERSLVCELENGRLAMIVMFYYLVRDVLEKPFYREIFQTLTGNV
jgi:hypothetical protein